MHAESPRILSHFPVQGLARIASEFPRLELVQVPGEGDLDADVEGEVLLTWAWGSPNVSEVVKRGVRWIHAFGTGVDRFPLEAVGDRILTCARGANAIPIAEWTLAVMLAFEKRLPEAWIDAPPPQWNRLEGIGGLYGKTLGLVGLGTIGCEIATRALAFGMRVRAHRRSGAPSPVPRVEIAGDLAELVASADHLVVAAAATRETRHLIDAGALSQTRKGAHLVNIARGSLVDQDALRHALDEGRIACASLDVVEPEPLPEGHWLFAHPRVRLSPHVSWSMPDSVDKILDTFVENLHHYLAGEPLEGRVDVERGY